MRKVRKMSKQSVKVRRTIHKCVDCGETWSRDPAPMVTDKIWKELQLLENDLICESCMHERFDFFLERPMRFGDLIRCPFNFGWARPTARDDEPVSFYDPYIDRWMREEQKRINRTERGSGPTKH